MPPVGFEPKISAGEQPQNYALDRAATGTGNLEYYFINYLSAFYQVSTYQIYSTIVSFG